MQQFRIQNVTPYGTQSYENAVFWSFFANSLWHKELANLNSELLNDINPLLPNKSKPVKIRSGRRNDK